MLTVQNNNDCGGGIRKENIKTIKMRVHTSMRQLKKRIKKKNNFRGRETFAYKNTFVESFKILLLHLL